MDDLQRAQSSLSRALGRARAGEDRELAQRVRELGEQLSHMLSGLLKLTKVHDPSNKAFDQPVKEFGNALSALVELLGTVHLVAVEDQVYVNDIRTRDEGKVAQRDLGGDLRRHNAGGISFHAPLDPAQTRALVAVLVAAPASRSPRAQASAALRERGVTTVELQGIFRFETARTSERTPRRDPAQLLERMLGLVTESWNNLHAGRMLNPLPLRRVVMETIDLGVEAPPFWLPYPEAPLHADHAVQVCATAILLGKAAGFHLGFLQDLGIAALTHDTGYLALQPGEGAASALQHHAFEGARIVLRQRGFSEAKVRRLRAVLEHHRDYADPSGPPSVAGAILRVAEDYVNAIRLYGAKVTRSAALGAMLKGAGKLYHPALPQLLVNALGRHPPGTLVELDGRRYGRVAVPARGPELWDKPLVRRMDPATRALTDEWIDLARGGQVVRAYPG
jgi:hypothetical protein